MKKYFKILSRCPLFAGIAEEELEGMLSCLGARVRHFEKNGYVLSEGEGANHLGIWLTGSGRVEQTDYFGTRRILGVLEAGELFAESFACAGMEAMPVDVAASEPSEVLLIESGRLLRSCGKNCTFHHRLIFNLTGILARKNLAFQQSFAVLSGRTTADKLMIYLKLCATRAGSRKFTVPFDRQGLADFLGVDRSGLSAEISKLRKAGVLHCRKNEFELK